MCVKIIVMMMVFFMIMMMITIQMLLPHKVYLDDEKRHSERRVKKVRLRDDLFSVEAELKKEP